MSRPEDVYSWTFMRAIWKHSSSMVPPAPYPNFAGRKGQEAAQRGPIRTKSHHVGPKGEWQPQFLRVDGIFPSFVTYGCAALCSLLHRCGTEPTIFSWTLNLPHPSTSLPPTLSLNETTFCPNLRCPLQKPLKLLRSRPATRSSA